MDLDRELRVKVFALTNIKPEDFGVH